MSGLRPILRPLKTNQKLRLLSFLVFSIFHLQIVKASSDSPDGMVHIHLGMVSGNYSGPAQTSFSVPQAINFEYEFLNSNKSTNYIRSLMAFDANKGRLVYFLNSFGFRQYANSNAKLYSFSRNGESFSLAPKVRYFYGADVGISQVVVQTLGTVLQATSTMFDLGAHIGASYHLKPNWAFEIVGGYSYGYGFSTVAVTGTTMRIMFGGSYYY